MKLSMWPYLLAVQLGEFTEALEDEAELASVQVHPPSALLYLQEADCRQHFLSVNVPFAPLLQQQPAHPSGPQPLYTEWADKSGMLRGC